MDRTSGFGRLAQLGVMTMASGAGVATALAQELYGGGADRFRLPADAACRHALPAPRKAAVAGRQERCGTVPCPPAGRVA
jgi:hypothetical protein